MDTALDTSFNTTLDTEALDADVSSPAVFDPAETHELIHDLRFASPVVVAPPPPHGVKRTIGVFVFCIVALFVSAVALSVQFTEVDGALLWITVLMGAVIIAILITGVLLPFVKELREHRRA